MARINIFLLPLFIIVLKTIGQDFSEISDNTPEPVSPNGFSDIISSGSPHPPRSWRYYRFDIPDGILGWQTAISNIKKGTPALYVRRGILPEEFSSKQLFDLHLSYIDFEYGDQIRGNRGWFGTEDANQRREEIHLSEGSTLVTSQDILTTYFVGIYNHSDEQAEYTFNSVIIDDNETPFASDILAVKPLDFEDGKFTITDLRAGEALYFKTTIPENKSSWHLKLNNTLGDSKLFISKGHIPDYTAGQQMDSGGAGGARMQRISSEIYYELPTGTELEGQEAFLTPGDYFIAVVTDLNAEENFSGDLISFGELNAIQVPVEEQIVEIDYQLSPSQIMLYELNLPVDEEYTLTIELANRPDHVDLAAGIDHLLPSPTNISRYGFSGNNRSTRSQKGIIGFNKKQGDKLQILIRSEHIGNDSPLETGQLIITKNKMLEADPNTGNFSVIEQGPYSWRVFKVAIPEDGILQAGEDPILGWVAEALTENLEDRNAISMFVAKGTPPEGSIEFFDDRPRTLGFSPNSPSKSESWPDGAVWQSLDSFIAAWGKPLSGGVYYVGVYNQSFEIPVSYQFRSRTTGTENTSAAIRIETLDYNNGIKEVTLAGNDRFHFYKMKLPLEPVRSWLLQADPDPGFELRIAVRSNYIPDVYAYNDSVANYNPFDHLSQKGGGMLISKPGGEFFQLLPAKGEEFLESGQEFYFYVHTENTGSELDDNLLTSGYKISSLGEIPTTELPFTGQTAVGEYDIEAGRVEIKTFSIPQGVTSFKASINKENNSGVYFFLREGTMVPINNAFTMYGLIGGTAEGSSYSETSISINNPKPGLYTCLLLHRLDRNPREIPPNARGTFSVELEMSSQLEFSGGSQTVIEQPPRTWRNFLLTVPNNDAATRLSGSVSSYLGADLMITPTDKESQPVLYIRPTSPPELSGVPTQNRSIPWEEKNQLQALQLDWTQKFRLYDSGPFIIHLRELLPMNAPLVPGSYWISVYNSSNSQNCNYQLASASIGEADSGATFEIQEIPLTDGKANLSLNPREAAYFRFSIAENSFRTWQLNLNKNLGEAGIAVKKDVIPDFRASLQGDTGNKENGFRLHRDRLDEKFTLLPPANEEFIPAGNYYVVVFGLGQERAQYSSTLGIGVSEVELHSVGEIEIIDLGEISTIHQPISRTVSYGSDEFKILRFDIGGSPAFAKISVDSDQLFIMYSVIPGALVPHQRSTGPFDPLTPNYPVDQGSDPISVRQNGQTLSFSNPLPGIYTIGAFSYPSNGAEQIISDVTFKIEAIETFDFPFLFPGPDQALDYAMPIAYDDKLNDTYDWDLYRLEPPQFIREETDTGTQFSPVLGWKLFLNNFKLSITKDAKNAFPAKFQFNDYLILTTPYFNHGDQFYATVFDGQGEYKISSAPVIPKSHWDMPVNYNTEFGDTGPVSLMKNDWDFYSVLASADNLGLLKTELIALEGAPDLYVRFNQAPTLHHNKDGFRGELLDFKLTGNSGGIANLVPVGNKNTHTLTPGYWIIGVHANAADSQYQLKLSTGLVEVIDNASEGFTLTDQFVRKGDINYYKITMPSIDSFDGCPASFKLSFNTIGGEVSLHLRETIPPGNPVDNPNLNQNNTSKIWDIADDKDDHWPYWNTAKNGIYEPGSYEFSFPPLRPGGAYFIGIRGIRDSQYSLTGTYSVTRIDDPADSSPDHITYGEIDNLDFMNEHRTFEMPAGSMRGFRVQTPNVDSAFRMSNTHSGNVEFRLEQGTLPALTGSSLRVDLDGNSILQGVGLADDRWPWLSGLDYYLLFNNVGLSPETVTIDLSGTVNKKPYLNWAPYLNDDQSKPGDINNPLGISNLIAYAFDFDPRTGRHRFSSIQPFPTHRLFTDGFNIHGTEFFLPTFPPEDVVFTLLKSHSLGGPWEQISSKMGENNWIGAGYIEETEVDQHFTKYQLLDLNPSLEAAAHYFQLRVELEGD